MESGKRTKCMGRGSCLDLMAVSSRETGLTENNKSNSKMDQEINIDIKVVRSQSREIEFKRRCIKSICSRKQTFQ